MLARDLDSINTNARLSSRALSNNQRASERFNTSAGRLNSTLSTTNNQLGQLGDGRGSIGRVGNQSERSGRQIDKFSGRLALMGKAAAALGPALIPIGALAVPAVAGLAAQLGFAAAAGGTAILAFQGVGDALKTMNAAHLEPTAANLQAAQVAMEGLGPAAQHLVKQLHNLGDEGKALRDSAAEGFLPGVSKSLDELQSRLPQVERILREVGDAAGDALAGGAASLASGRWDDFFNFLETDARSSLSDLATSVGNVTHALAELMMATDPLADDWSQWLVTATERFDKWAQGLDQTQGFQDFINYVRTNGPQVAETVGAIGSALVDVVTAAAPIGGPILHGLESLAKVVSVIAKSDLGTPLFGLAAALSALSLAQRGLAGLGRTVGGLGSTFTPITAGARRASGSIRLFSRDLVAMRGEYARMGATSAVITSAMSNTTGAAQRTRASLVGVGKTAGILGGLALVTSGAADSMGVMNTAMGATTGFMIGGPWGAAIGGGIGLILDFAGGNKDAAVEIASVTDTLNEQTGAITANTRAKVSQSLESEGLLQDAEALGLNLDRVTSAALGQKAALTQLQASLDQQVAADQAAGMGSSQRAVDLSNLIGKIREHAGATADDVAEAKRLIAANGAAADSTKDVADAFGLASQAATDFAAAVTAANEVLSGRSALRDYEAAIDAVTAGLKENGRTLDINTDKGRQNQANLDGLAASSIAYAQTLGRSNRIRFMQQARADFIDAAKKLGMTKVAARGLADELQLFDRTTHKVNVDTKGATDKVKHLGDLFNALPDDVQTDIKANGIPKTMAQVNALVRKYGLTEEQRTALIGLKDGATKPTKAILALLDKADRQRPNPKITADASNANSVINGIIARVIPNKSFTITANQITNRIVNKVNPYGHAAGGLILGPGTGTSDSVPINASNGEFVMKTAAVNKYGPDFMHRVNAMQFASGGYVGRSATIASAAQSMSLVGLRIEGRMKIDGGDAWVRGIIVEETDADRRFVKTRGGG